MRMRLNQMPKDEIKRRIAELFNLVDPSYRPLSVIMHAYKLIRLAPKVPRAPVFCVDHIVDKKIAVVILVVPMMLGARR
jgi:hypothetical protein